MIKFFVYDGDDLVASFSNYLHAHSYLNTYAAFKAGIAQHDNMILPFPADSEDVYKRVFCKTFKKLRVEECD